VEGGAPLLLPPTPILKEDNWPLLTVTKGFFENLAQQGAHAGPVTYGATTARL
jgi:coatomer subunit alpha